jgi:OFA family oxalate/formate antiporter-like MFS transporter
MGTKINMAGRNAKGWRSVIGCAIAIFWSGALIFGYPGVMGEYWRTTFHSGTGLVMTFVLVSLGIGTFLCGKWHMKTGTRVAYLIGTAVQLVGMLFVIYANTIYMVWIWAFMTGFASCFIYAPGLGTVQNWFPHRRGLVTGIVNLVFGCAAAVMCPIFNIMLENLGYVKMNWIVMILIAIVNIIGAFMAEMPDRTKMSESEKAAHEQILDEIAAKRASGAVAKGPGVSLTPREAVKTKGFWMLWLTWAFMGAAGISMVSLSKNYSVFLGIEGVLALTCFNLTNGISRIVAGTLSDLMGRRTLGLYSFVLGAVGYACLPMIHTLAPLCIFSAFVGFAFGTLFAISGPLATDLFGLKYFGMNFGLIFTAYGFVGGIVGPLLASAVLNATGSFTLVFVYLAVFCLLAGIFIMRSKNEKKAQN